MQLYMVFDRDGRFAETTIHATREQAMHKYMHITRLLGHSHGVTVARISAEALDPHEMFEYAETHYIERVDRDSSVQEEIHLREV